MTSMIVNILACVFESIIIFMFFDAYIEKQDEIKSYLYGVSIVILAGLIALSNIVLDLGLLNLIFVIVSTFFIMYVYNKNIKINLILSIISVVILTVSEIIVGFLITMFTGVAMNQIYTINEYQILGTILSKLFAFYIMKYFCVIHKKDNGFTVKTSYWFLFLIMFISSGMSIFLIFKLQYESNLETLNIVSVLCSFGLLYSTFFTLYLYENLSRQAKIEQKQEVFQQQIKAQSKHLDEILIAQREIKKLRHDLVNHNISIQKYFENEDYKSGLEYLKNINEVVNVSEQDVATGNTALDAIINTKKSIAQSKNIEFVTNIQIPENIFVDAIDICIIFGNALDNCIEACERIDNGLKKISLSIVYEDNSVICKIVNTAEKRKNKFLKTLKRDSANHGFGIENIESALAKYKHVCRFKRDEKEFQLSFVIFKN